MQCYKCGKPAVGQCQMCGKFYCSDHGDVACNDCKPKFERAVEEQRFGPFSRYVLPIAYFIVYAIAGGMLGLIPVVVVRGISSQRAACLLPICPPVGSVIGLVLAVAFRARIERISGLRGIIGATLLASPFLCFACYAVQIISSVQNWNEGLEYWRRAEELGLATPQSPSATTSPWWPGLLICLGIFGVISVIIVIVAARLMSPKRKSSQPAHEVAEDEGEHSDMGLMDPDH